MRDTHATEGENNECTNATPNEIILYQPDSTFTLDVRVDRDTVWLNRNQIAALFERDVKTIGKHINNALQEELVGYPSVAKFATVQQEGERTVTRMIEHYNLDVIISVGYRVKSKRGIQFRTWANNVLREYLLRGYSVNERLLNMESRMDRKFAEYDHRLIELSGKVDFYVKASLPPIEGVFFNGQIFDAHKFVCGLVKSAMQRIILVDNYIDETVLTLLDKRRPGVTAKIFTQPVTRQLALDIRRHDKQYAPIEIVEVCNIHDRFFIVDDTLYHIGASVKDLGKKLFAFSQMAISPSVIIDHL